MTNKFKWWQTSVGYQVYPASFYDSNNDGYGDLPGLIEKLAYIKNLGVDFIWVCPFFKSPKDDNGYDISNHYEVDPSFGQTSDMKLLIDEAHKIGLKVIFDFVLNHTSDEHPWFIDAKRGPISKYYDYYLWQKPKIEKGLKNKPNNLRGFFGRSVWTYVESIDSYYMHIFSRKMPDLNWSNKKLRKEMYQIARFYLDLGVDGFRLDALAHLGRDMTFVDSTMKVDDDGLVLDTSKYSNREEIFTYLQEFKKEVLDHYDCLTVGEVGGNMTPLDAIKYADFVNGSVNMVFNFETAWENDAYGSYHKTDDQIITNVVNLRHNFKKWFDACYLKAWLPLYYNNHDHPRVLSQYGSVKYRNESAKMLATTLLFMYGTPFIYNGEEIGMSNVDYTKLEDFNDVSDQPTIANAKNEEEKQLALRFLRRTSRSNGHQIMQWNANDNAGFSKSKPWQKVNGNYKEVNVEDQINDEHSILSFYKKALLIRKETDVLHAVINSEFTLTNLDNKDVFSYVHKTKKFDLVVISNFRDKDINFDSELDIRDAKILLTNYARKDIKTNNLVLKPFESYLLRVEHE